MKTRLLSFVVVLFAPGLLLAQSQTNNYPFNQPLFRNLQAPSSSESRPSSTDKMYEDIEIFRRLLDRKLSAYYPLVVSAGFGGGMMGMQGGGMMGMQGAMSNQMPGMQPMLTTYTQIDHNLEGVYLESVGVVFTATIGSLKARGKAETAPPVPVDEWESVRRQIRREKDEPPKAEASKPLELSDVLLKMLSEQGRHFSQLKDNESLTIILTVRESRSATAKKYAKKADQERPDIDQKLHDLEMMGDLHHKQGKHDEAITTYLKILELGHESKQEAALRRKLAQCYLAQEKYDKARTELDAAVALLKKGKDDKSKTVAPAELPEKIIIAVPKRLLDFATTNKLPFEEFRNKATVRKLTFGEQRH